MEGQTSRLLVVDGTNLYWRSYHGLVHTAMEEDGRPTFAVFGTLNSLATSCRRHTPTHMVVVFDWGKSAYRLAMWPKYKAGRPNSDIVDHDDAETQLAITRDILNQFNIVTYREYEVEADDVLAAVVYRFKNDVDEVIVLTGDKDMRQLADDNVKVVHPRGGEEQVWTRQAVFEHYGVAPNRLPEVFALCGDKVDNIPGVPGIGEKTAIKLIQKHGDLSKVALSDEKKIEGYRHDIEMSFKLVELRPDLSVFELKLDDIIFSPTTSIGPGSKVLRGSLNELGFDSLVSRWTNGSLWAERGVRLRDLAAKHK